ncbi:MAG: hypothetical protein ACI4EN_05980 [Butyrivibrio sp.]
MKKTLKKVIRALCFLIGLVIILEAASLIIKPKDEIYNCYAVEQKLKSMKLEYNSPDVLFAGDSETYANFSPLQMWNEQGFTSYVMGISAQRLCDTYALLKEALEDEGVRLVVLETNCLYRNSSTYNDNKDKVMNVASDIFPVLKYHSRWQNYLPGANGETFVSEERMYKGFRLRFNKEKYSGKEWMEETDSVEKISNRNLEYLDAIKELCKEKNVELMLVSAPSPKCWNYKRHNAVVQWSEENGIDFLDMNLMDKELEIDWNKDSRDGGNHMNYYGAVKVSSYLSAYLSDKYNLPDHREDEAYNNWNESYEKYAETINKKTSSKKK